MTSYRKETESEHSARFDDHAERWAATARDMRAWAEGEAEMQAEADAEEWAAREAQARDAGPQVVWVRHNQDSRSAAVASPSTEYLLIVHTAPRGFGFNWHLHRAVGLTASVVASGYQLRVLDAQEQAEAALTEAWFCSEWRGSEADNET
jgi:hypothetical protein